MTEHKPLPLPLSPAAAALRPATGPVTPEPEKTPEKVPEIGGPKGAEPTRFGDWERKGRCSDF